MQDGNNGKTIVRYAMEYGIYFGLFLIVKFLITTQSTKFIALNVLAEILFETRKKEGWVLSICGHLVFSYFSLRRY